MSLLTDPLLQCLPWPFPQIWLNRAGKLKALCLRLSDQSPLAVSRLSFGVSLFSHAWWAMSSYGATSRTGSVLEENRQCLLYPCDMFSWESVYWEPWHTCIPMMAAGTDKDGFLVKPGLAYMTFLSVWMFFGGAKISMCVPLPSFETSVQVRVYLFFLFPPPSLSLLYVFRDDIGLWWALGANAVWNRFSIKKSNSAAV